MSWAANNGDMHQHAAATVGSPRRGGGGGGGAAGGGGGGGGLEELHPPWTANEYRGVLQWKKVDGKDDFADTMLVEKKVCKWEERLVVLAMNVVVWYKSKKGRVDADEIPQGYMRLDEARLDKVKLREDLTGVWPKRENVVNCFSLTDDNDHDNVVVIRTENRAAYERWYDTLYKKIPSLREQARELNRWGKGLQHLNRHIKKPITLKTNCKADEVSAWVDEMKELRERIAQWRPVLKMFKNFCELNHEKSEAYLEWFTSSGGGIMKDVTDSEDAMLDFWRRQFTDIEKVKVKVNKATEVSFFREDFAPTVKFCSDLLSLLNTHNEYKRSVMRTGDGNEFGEMRAKLQALIKHLQSFPVADDVNMNTGYEKGALKCGDTIWEYEAMPSVAANHVELRARVDPDANPFFTIGGFEMLSQDFGQVLWNKASFVWYHTELPFTIRYNWKRAEQVFVFHGVKGEPKRGQWAVLPSFKWNGKNGLQPVLSSGSQLDPDIKPNFASVVCGGGKVPLPVMLLVALLKHIRHTTQTLWGFS